MKCEKCGSEALVPITPYLNLCLSCGNEMANDEELNKHIKKVRELAKKKGDEKWSTVEIKEK